MSSEPSRLVANRYRLVELLGQGGMGRVWRAQDEYFHREVAIKEMVPPAGLSVEERDEIRHRSMREARAIARLSHANVVRIFDVIRTEAYPWIVMEYIPSRSLQDVLARDGVLPPARAAEIGMGVLAALQAAHRLQMLHRDVKPGNVLLGERGRVVLTDFGLATLPGDATITRTGLVLGTAAYIAPERARGEDATAEGDLWSLGATLFAAVEGRAPFARATAIASLTALATEEPPKPQRAGVLRPVISGLLRKDPAARLTAYQAQHLLARAAGKGQGRGVSLLTGVRRPRELPRTAPLPIGPPPPEQPSSAQPVPAAPPAERPPAVPADAVVVLGTGAPPAEPPETDEPALPEQRSAEPPAPDQPPETAEGTAEPAAPEQRAASQRHAVPDRETTSRPEATSRPQHVPVPATWAGRSGTRRVWLGAAAAAVAVLLAVLGLPRLVGHATTAGTSSAAGASPAPASSPTPDTPSPAPSPTTSLKPQVPVGWEVYEDPTGYSVLAPTGWNVSLEGTIRYWREPGGGRILAVDQTDSPKPDAVQDWRQQEQVRLGRGDWVDYRKVRIEVVEDYFLYAADWEFTHTVDGNRMHVVNRGFATASDQAYAIYWATPDEDWAENLDLFRLITSTFVPDHQD